MEKWTEKEKYLIALGFSLGVKAQETVGKEVDFSQLPNTVIFADNMLNDKENFENQLFAAICNTFKNVYVAYQKLKHEKAKNES